MVYRAPNTFLSERNLSLNGIDVRYPASSISHFDEIAAKSKSSNGYADKAQEKDNSEPKNAPKSQRANRTANFSYYVVFRINQVIVTHNQLS